MYILYIYICIIPHTIPARALKPYSIIFRYLDPLDRHHGICIIHGHVAWKLYFLNPLQAPRFLLLKKSGYLLMTSQSLWSKAGPLRVLSWDACCTDEALASSESHDSSFLQPLFQGFPEKTPEICAASCSDGRRREQLASTSGSTGRAQAVDCRHNSGHRALKSCRGALRWCHSALNWCCGHSTWLQVPFFDERLLKCWVFRPCGTLDGEHSSLQPWCNKSCC